MKTEHRHETGIAVLSLIAAMAVLILLEQLFGIFLSSSGLAIYGSVWALMSVARMLRGRSLAAGILLPALLGSLCLFAVLPLNPRHAFLNDLRRVRPGMSQQQVENVMGKYLTGTGWPANPLCRPNPSTGKALVLPSSLVYRWSDHESDWGIVKFEDARVSDVSFDPD